MSFQPLDPQVVIDPFVVASFTGSDNRTGLYLDADSVNSSFLIQTNNTNAVYIDKFHNVGINTVAPASQLDVNSADGACIQLTYNNSSNKANINVASDGKMSLIASGSEVNVDAASDFNIKSHNGTSTGLKLNNTLVRSTADQLNYVNVTTGAATASKALVLDSNKDISGLRNFSAVNITGELQTAAQPKISSVDVLDVTTHNGSTIGLKLGGTLVTATAAKLNYVDTTPGTASATKALIVDSNLDITGINSLSAASLTGELQTAAQPKITSIGTLSGLTLDGSLLGLTDLSINTTTSGRTVVINSDVGNCLQLCYDTTSGSPTNYIDFLVSGAGDLSLSPSGGNVDITTHNGSTLGLKLGGTLVTATAAQINYLQGTTLGSAASGKALIFDSSRNIDNINNLTATNLTGTLQTAAQPNINSVNVLNIANHNGSTIGLKLNNVLVSATATELNYVDTTAGAAEASKALILDASKDISGINSLGAASLTGELQTASQPKITSVAVLDITGHDGTTQGLKLGGTLITATGAQINGIFSGGSGGGTFGDLTVSNDLTLSGHDGSTSGLILGSTLVTATGAQLNYNTVTPGTAAASKALVLDASLDIAGINSLSAAELTGELQTAAQPKITSVGTLTSITTSGSLTMGTTTISEAEIGVLDTVTPGTATASKALVLDSSLDIAGINSLSATELTGELQTAAQPKITSTGTLTSITTSGDLTLGATTISEADIGVLDGVTPGTATASKALVLDANKDIATINSLTATSITGTLQTVAQPNITSTGTLTSLAVSSGTTTNTFTSAFTSNGNNTIVLHNTVNGFAGGINFTALNGSGNSKNVFTIAPSYFTTTNNSEAAQCSFSTIFNGSIYTPLKILGTGGVQIARTNSGQILTLGTSAGTAGSYGEIVMNGPSWGLLTIRGTFIDSANSKVGFYGTLDGGSNLMFEVTPSASGGIITGLKNLTVSDTITAISLNTTFLNTTRSIRQNNSSGSMQIWTSGVSATQNAFNPFSSALVTAGNPTLGVITSNLGTNYIIEGFVNPTFTETYTITATYTRCFFKVWLDGVLQLNNTSIDSADPNTLLFTTPCVSNVKRCIYIQVIPTNSTSLSGVCTLSWSSASRTSQTIPIGLSTGVNENIRTQAMASPNIFTVYSLTGASATPLKGEMVIDTSGNLAITSSGLTTSIGATNSFNVAGHNGTTLGLKLAGTLVTASAAELNYNTVTPGTATASKTLVLDSSLDIAGINSLSATELTGELQTAAQPKITSVGTLTSLIVENDLECGGNLIIGGTIIAETEIVHLDGAAPGEAAALKAIITDADNSIAGINSLTATSLTGELQTAAQPKITSTGTLTSITTSGSLTMGTTTISEAEIGVLDTVTPGTATASKALVLDANKDIATINSLTAISITGTLQTAAQPSITSVGTLTSITMSGDLTIGTTVISESEIAKIDGVTPGTTSASKALIVDSNKDIVGINNLSAAELSGTIQTAAQPNIASVNALDITTHDGATVGLKLGGVLLTATAADLNSFSAGTGSSTFADANVTSDLTLSGHNGSTNGLILGSTLVVATGAQLNYNTVTPGTADASKALVLDANKDIATINSLTATSITGELQTAAQPKITSTGTLTSITTSGTLTIGAIEISETEIAKIDGVTPGTAAASKALILDANKDIATINSLTATSITGTLQTAAQPSITSVGTLTSITTSGDLTMGTTVISESEIGVLDTVTPGTAAASKALILDANKDIATINSLTATSLTGELQTAAQPKISSVDVLDITTHNNSTIGLSLGGSLVVASATQLNYTIATPGTAAASKALVLDANKDIATINSLTATSITGELQTAAQPKITSTGTLTSITTSGSLTMGTTTISEAEIGVLDAVTPGTAAASKALVLDSSKDISTIHKLSTELLAVGSPANTDLPVEIGFTSYQYTGAYAYSNNSNAHGLIDAGLGPVANYSLRADGRILVTGEIGITSDHRLKENVTELTYDVSKKFIMTTKPVKFNWKNGDGVKDYGYIAQEVLKAGFDDLVTVVPHPGMEGSIDEDGFINPEGAKFTLGSGKIVPLLALNQREIFNELSATDQKIATLEERLVGLEAIIAKLG